MKARGLRIAHIDTGANLRGGQRQMLMLARGLRERAHDQTIVCLESSAVEAAARSAGLQVFALPPFDPGHAFGAMLWRQELQARTPDIIHAHDGRGQTLAWLASLGLPVRRIATRRVTFLPSDRWSYRLKYAHTCDAVVAVSENIRELSVRAGVPRERIEVIPDGIEVPAALPSAVQRLRIRIGWGCSERDFVVGLLGASTPEKGHDVALAAASLLANRVPDARWVFAGDDTASAGPRSAAAVGARPSGPIHFVEVQSLDDFFPGIDLFVMPSRAEGLGSSALWAMAYGVPVVATRVGGLPEIVVENETGWLIPPDSSPALAEAVHFAWLNQDKLAAFGAAGRKRAEQFSAAIMVSRTEALYRRLAANER